jgi:hypothetical protein
VLFLGASVPADDLADFLDLQQPLALALSCSMSAALAGAARSVAAAHEVGVPVIGGGRALPTEWRSSARSRRALRVPRDAVDILRAWELSHPIASSSLRTRSPSTCARPPVPCADRDSDGASATARRQGWRWLRSSTVWCKLSKVPPLANRSDRRAVRRTRQPGRVRPWSPRCRRRRWRGVARSRGFRRSWCGVLGCRTWTFRRCRTVPKGVAETRRE